MHRNFQVLYGWGGNNTVILILRTRSRSGRCKDSSQLKETDAMT